MERFAKLAVNALNQILDTPITSLDLETPPDRTFGDLGFPCFKLAKAYRLAPPQLALSLVEKLKTLPPFGLTFQAVGPYVNFTAPAQAVYENLLSDILKGPDLGTYGKLPPDSRETWVIEYSSPNVAKPFMIYHFRPTGLGACLDRVGRYRGFKMISINHLGDWGTQYGKLYVANQVYRGGSTTPPSFKELVDIYVRFHQDVEKDPTLEIRGREAFAKLEKKDPEVTEFWKICKEISLKEFEKIYERFDVHFDHIWGESYYEDQLRPLLADLKKREIITQSEGAWVAHVTDEKGKELTPCILEKSDGSTIYATRDVAAGIYRHKNFNFDRMTYVVGGEQKLHFQQVFGVLRKMGHEWVSKCEHVATGLYRFKDSKMSTRKGNFVTLDDVWGLAKERVDQLLKERETDRVLTPAEHQDIAEKVAIAGIVFNDLYADPAREVEFDVERIVSFEGETGPYLQYAHTRCLSILRKAQDAGFKSIQYNPHLISQFKTHEELMLVKTLGEFPMHLERTLKFAKASQLANFLIDLTKAFGAFYRECHVLGVEKELTEARLMLVESTRRVLAQGLKLIGIPTPEKM
jgi:arginyl-tRNA synthetase